MRPPLQVLDIVDRSAGHAAGAKAGDRLRRGKGPAPAGYHLGHRRVVVEPPAQVHEVRVRFQVRSEEHTSELQSLMRISYAVFCLKKKTTLTDIETLLPSNADIHT